LSAKRFATEALLMKNSMNTVCLSKNVAEILVQNAQELEEYANNLETQLE
jgi:hypothetical protein